MSEVQEVDNLQISEGERQNLKELADLLKDSAERLKYEISSKVVGGKDIDLVCTVSGPMLEGPQNTTALTRARFFFGVLEEITRGAVGGSQFEIDQVIKPSEDKEFNDLNILAHDGSIVVKPKTGTQIEIINGNV